MQGKEGIEADKGVSSDRVLALARGGEPWGSLYLR